MEVHYLVTSISFIIILLQLLFIKWSKGPYDDDDDERLYSCYIAPGRSCYYIFLKRAWLLRILKMGLLFEAIMVVEASGFIEQYLKILLYLKYQ